MLFLGVSTTGLVIRLAGLSVWSEGQVKDASGREPVVELRGR